MSWYDSGMPVINDAEVLATAELIRRLWVETTGDAADPYLGPYADQPPQVDAARDAAAPPRPRYAGSRAADGWQARADQWLDNPDWDTSAAPLFVGVPGGTDIDELSQAIRLCQRAGLLPATPNGVMYIPAELVPPGSEEE